MTEREMIKLLAKVVYGMAEAEARRNHIPGRTCAEGCCLQIIRELEELEKAEEEKENAK